MNMSDMPRHDFYQTPTELIVSLYVKGYGKAPQREAVKVEYHADHVVIGLPEIEGSSAQSFQLPLAGTVIPSECTERILGSKIELRLMKAEPVQWSTVISTTDPKSAPTVPVLSSAVPMSAKPSSPTQPNTLMDNLDPHTIAKLSGGGSSATEPNAILLSPNNPKTKEKKNWDKLVLDDEDDSADPNAGGDAALQKFFNEIYANGDEDTKRAMIKSYTESGGTALSVNWDTVGKEKTPVRPPEGMYEMKL